MWLTYMSSLNNNIDHLRDTNYKIPHMNKCKMEQEGTLPMVLYVTDSTELLIEMMDAMDDESIDDDDEDVENTNFC